MHARVTRVRVKPGRLEEFVSVFQELTVPAADRQREFEGALLLSDAENDKTIVISMWETEADMLAVENS